MSAVAEAKRWYWQRISAMVLALCVIVHIAGMIYAVRGGLTAGEILSRTRGSVAFAAFYSTFVLACVVHVPIGLTNVCEEWLGMNRFLSVTTAKLATVTLLFLGLRAVFGVYSA